MKKRKHNGWFETFPLSKGEKHPQWLIDGRKWLTKEVGKPCKAFAIGCPVCLWWMNFIQLENDLREDV